MYLITSVKNNWLAHKKDPQLVYWVIETPLETFRLYYTHFYKNRPSYIIVELKI